MKNEIDSILAQLKNYRPKQQRHLWATAGVATVTLFSMMAAFGTASSGLPLELQQKAVVENLALPSLPPINGTDQVFLHEERVRQGDTIGKLMARLDVDDAAAEEFIRTSKSTEILFRQLSPGKNLTARTGSHGELLSLIFPLNGANDRALFIERSSEDGFSVNEKSLALETQVVMKSAEIRHSLFGAADAAGIPDAVASQLAEIFGGDIDFHRDLRKGDRFSVIYESINHFGHSVRSGKILAAEFENNGKAYRAAWFSDTSTGTKTGGYYTADGKSIRKAFLRSPLEFSRITSGFSLSRFHPLLQKWRAHKGVDYGAPIGARVKATSDGVVEFSGVQGGYGKVIILRHQGRYTTLYGHLSGFAAGLRKGSHVSQGDVIGFVGATGLASGPHLHYEFRISDVHQNPLAMTLPSAPPLTQQQLSLFREITGEHLTRLELLRGLNIAQLD